MAAKTDGGKEVSICGAPAAERRHSISKIYLNRITKNRHPLWVLPVDMEWVANQTKADGRIAGKGLEAITCIPPKPTSYKEASTGHFACQAHDDMFNPVDTGIKFPDQQEYVCIETANATGDDKELDEALFLLAYMPILSTMSMLRGTRKALYELRKKKGNHAAIRNRQTKTAGMYCRVNVYKRHFDRRFAKSGECNMTHHLVAVQPHTRIAVGHLDIDDEKVLSVLPGEGVSWLIISHLSDDATRLKGKVAELVNDWPKKLADAANKRPLIDAVTGSYNSFMSPEDYAEWAQEDKDELGKAAARVLLDQLG